MRYHHLTGAFIASAFLLVACSGGTSAPPAATPLLPPAGTQSIASVNPDACGPSRVYVADYGHSDVEIYPQGVSNPAPCGKITAGISAPQAVYVDAKGKVYVSNYLTHTVTEYSSGTLKLTITLPTPAYDIFVGMGRTLYAAEPDTGTVEEYAKGATSPFLSVTVNGECYGVATDNKNNLYVSYLSNADGVSHVEKFAPKSTTGTDMGFTLPFAGELKLDKQNDIVIGDRNDNILEIFPPGATSPSQTFPTPGGRPVYLALDNAESLVYVDGLFGVTIFDYPSGTAINSISTGLHSPSGVALFPPAPY